MERGVYFDAWFPRQHCYHPSLPARRLKMIDDLHDYRATILVWSALGGGSLSLPYLEQEAYGEIDPRFRFYGFVNDSEFIQACQEAGIKVFGIVFEVQGWEFPAELSETEDAILSLNELRGVGKRATLGLREFSQNRYPKLWTPVQVYFPEGLKNSDGEQVTDLIEECCSRDIYGTPCHARWVECPDREHQCYLMDRNNPVWREYLKAIIRIQIDAGVDGVQLDEAELPITSFQYGGCFCKECMRGFREYLQALPEGEFPAELAGLNLDTFHYGEWLLARGYDFKKDREDSPLFWQYSRFQIGNIARYFAELADYARTYAAGKGRDILVSGNFFNLVAHWYYPMEPKVDLMITEMRNTRYRQPAWYRYVAGFAGEKPVIVVENPYGGVIPELIEKLRVGKGYDLFRMSLYEAAALGANMSVPYGAWMGSVVEDSFYAPHELCAEIQRFLGDHENLFSHKTYSEVAVVYSVESNYLRGTGKGLYSDNRYNLSTSEVGPFWQVCAALGEAAQPYDVLFFPDGELHPDDLTFASLRRYRTLILPDCRYITLAQVELLEACLAGDIHLLVLGGFGLNLPSETRERVLGHPNVHVLLEEDAFDTGLLPFGPQASCSPSDDLAINVMQVQDGAAVQLIRYAYDPEQDCVPRLPELSLDLRLPGAFTALEALSPGEGFQATMQVDGNCYRLRLENVPLYSVLLLKSR